MLPETEQGTLIQGIMITLPNKTKSGLVFVLLAVCFTAACIDLSVIRQFTETAAAVNQRFPALVRDLSASCMRQRAFQIKRDKVLAPEELMSALMAPVSGSGDGLEPRCGLFKQQEERLLQANEVLVGYLQTLGELAEDDVTSYGDSLRGLDDSFTGVNIFNESEVNAVKELARIVLRSATEGYRRKTLRTIITNHDAQIATLTTKMSDIIQRKYVAQLRNEQDELDNYYITSVKEYELAARAGSAHLASGTNPNPPLNLLPITEAYRTWETERDHLQRKMSAAAAFGKALERIKGGHHALAQGRGSLDDRAVLQLALREARNIFLLIDEFRSAF